MVTRYTLALLACVLFLSLTVSGMQTIRSSPSLVTRRGWIQTASRIMPPTKAFLVDMPFRNTHLMDEKLMAVSDPRSPLYGKHLSKVETEELYAPLREHVDLVKEWIMTASTRCSIREASAGSTLFVECPTGAVEELFQVRFSMFEHKTIDTSDPLHHFDRIARTTERLTVPTQIAELIEFIEDINDFPLLNRKSRSLLPQPDISVSVIGGSNVLRVSTTVNATVYDEAQILVTQGENIRSLTVTLNPPPGSDMASHTENFYSMANYESVDVSVTGISGNSSSTVTYGSTVFPSDWITADLVARLYQIPPGTKGTNPDNSQCVVEFDRQYYSSTDLHEFSYLMGLPDPEVSIFGSNNEDHPGGESTLDIEWVTAVGVGVPTEFWYVDGGFLAHWVATLLDAANPPLINSVSYGIPESDLPEAMMTRLNNQFKILGQRGVGIISTSGDLGDSDGTQDCQADEPDFPSSSPYTTSLGASFIFTATDTPLCNGTGDILGMQVKCDATAELPCAADAGTGFTTGGGFSYTFDRPPYQDDAVQAYLDTANLPATDYFNSEGRGFNDVGALGYNIVVYLRGETSISGGTSASGPIFAGVVGLINDALLNANLPPLGFMNPFLYQTAADYPGSFNQVLSGNNRCAETGTNGELQTCCLNGFEAQAGWNPLTGLGTPNFVVLRDAAIEFAIAAQ